MQSTTIHMAYIYRYLRGMYYNNIVGYKCIIYNSAYIRAMYEPHRKVQIKLRGDCGCKHITLIYGCFRIESVTDI